MSWPMVKRNLMRTKELELKGDPETGTRSEEEKRLTGERRSRIERRTGKAANSLRTTSSLFSRSVSGAPSETRTARHIFGIPSGDNDFRGYPDVLRTLDWIEGLANS